jgi:hypothetical protein
VTICLRKTRFRFQNAHLEHESVNGSAAFPL